MDGKAVCKKRRRKTQGVQAEVYRLLRKSPNNLCLLENDKSRTSLGLLLVLNSRIEQNMIVSTRAFLEKKCCAVAP